MLVRMKEKFPLNHWRQLFNFTRHVGWNTPKQCSH